MSAIQELREENKVLRRALQDTLWMAQRYADNRSTYAPWVFNTTLHSLGAIGLEELYLRTKTGGHRIPYARDGQLGEWDPKRQGFVKEHKDGPAEEQ